MFVTLQNLIYVFTYILFYRIHNKKYSSYFAERVKRCKKKKRREKENKIKGKIDANVETELKINKR